MAAGKKDEKADKEKDQPSVDEAAIAEAKKKKKKFFMVIGLAILLVLISIGATFFIVSKLMSPKSSDVDDESSVETSESEDTVAAAPVIYYPLKPNFTVNYDVNGRQRFLQVELTLMCREAEVLKTLELHMPAVRNGLVMLLSGQVFEELQTLEGKEKLRAAALVTIQDIINKETAALAAKNKDEDSEDEEESEKSKGKSKDNKAKPLEPNIEQVLFTQFVMQ